MNRTSGEFANLSSTAARFMKSARGRLERAIVHALLARRGSAGGLDTAVTDATHELRAEGLSERATLSVLDDLVADAGCACGTERPLLGSGESRWMPVRERVFELATIALATPLVIPSA